MAQAQARAHIAQAPARNAGFLWRIDQQGRSSWLYGTVHVNAIDWAMPGPQVAAPLRASDVLAVELNLAEPQSVPPQALKLAFAPAPLDAATAQRLHQAHQRDCLPWHADHTLGQLGLALVGSQAQRIGLHAGYGADLRLVQLAQRMGKPIVALETMADQLQALLPATQAELDARVRGVIDDFESGQLQRDLHALSAAWQNGDWPAIERTEADMHAHHPALAHRLNAQRNAPMAQKIDQLHRSGQRVFVAVGVLHMAGSASLPTLLKARGYTVTAVDLPRSR